MVTFKEWSFLALILVVGGTLGWGLGVVGLGAWIALPVAFVFAVGWGVFTILRDRRLHPEFYDPVYWEIVNSVHGRDDGQWVATDRPDESSVSGTRPCGCYPWELCDDD